MCLLTPVSSLTCPKGRDTACCSLDQCPVHLPGGLQNPGLASFLRDTGGPKLSRSPPPFTPAWELGRKDSHGPFVIREFPSTYGLCQKASFPLKAQPTAQGWKGLPFSGTLMGLARDVKLAWLGEALLAVQSGHGQEKLNASHTLILNCP